MRCSTFRALVDPYAFGNLKRSSVTTEAQIMLLSVFLVAKPQILQQKSNLLQGYWITHRNNRKAGEKGWERAGIEVDLGIHVAETSQRSLQGPTAGMSEIQTFFFFSNIVFYSIKIESPGRACLIFSKLRSAAHTLFGAREAH